ncbi:nuclear transport factor 2 family protein [Marinomonas sp. IMCC 4694]|uniref:nuclear transport factor 2 family protein n=1 Tax=Marinomonas sp. IMCC 4694 TaxID=2605432 RepID=UPI0011E89748|nr:nuclear transport factor 2 family protein [Marinomonas sp. IMCC 4694]TYL48957.1 hypothetical protein FXV75_14110 [Marinomonas sp. IMCC 4694]
MSNHAMEAMLIEWQCQKLVTRSVNLLDQRDWIALASCYTEDGILYRPSAPLVPIKGRDAILHSFTSRPAKETCHALTNVETTVIDAFRAVVTSRVVLFSGEIKVDHCDSMVQANADVYIGRFIDDIICVSGEWRIAKRQGSIELQYKGA